MKSSEVRRKWRCSPVEIKIPNLSLVVLIGASGSGKSTFARKHFKPQEVLSSDHCRAIVGDDETNQDATTDAFELLHFTAAKRLKNGLLTVIDATNVQSESRSTLLKLAKEYHCLPVAIVFKLPEKVCEARNKQRLNRNFGPHVVRQQMRQLRSSLRCLRKEGFRHIFILESEAQIESLPPIVRDPLYNDKRHLTGPFDIIGDVHGCFSELSSLLQLMGYEVNAVEDDGKNLGWQVQAPPGRTAVFVGDLVDRGPDSVAVLRLVMSMVRAGTALCVPGNHDMKLLKWIEGKEVQLKHGLDLTVKQLEGESGEFRAQVRRFLDDLVSHYVFDQGQLVVAHAGLREEMQGRGSGAVRAFCLYGETTGESDEYGLPVRYNWALDYRGKAMVVYGHTAVTEAQWLNRTIDIDTGCVYGGKLTGLRYPERELVSVPALEMYCHPSRPMKLLAPEAPAQAQHLSDDLLDIEDVTGRRVVNTRLRGNLTVQEENAIAALEVMSRFAVNPKWLIYLPPTMSPSETSAQENYLEHPAEAMAYYRKRGVNQVICEQKHMGSRAVVVLCRDEAVAFSRFGIAGEGRGICYTRTGRRFFNDLNLEVALLDRLAEALSHSGFWQTHETDWVCLDCELMPWSAKAQQLIKDQYASVASAAGASLPVAVQLLEQTAARGQVEAEECAHRFGQRLQMVQQYAQAYRAYCWPVQSIDDFKLAPFHILATEGEVHADKTHEWHLQQIASFCASDPALLLATPSRVVDVNNEESVQNAVDWWLSLTDEGGEGMVVKPMDFIATHKGELLQPAIKSRGREYLRIIYGAEYSLPQNLNRLRSRGLSAKRSLALREFALGIEALERFVRREPLRRIHECVFAVLALESEEVDPRL